jgi:ABC-2 type transport system permease protein
MHKTWVVASREYHAMVRTKAFLITVLLMPVLMGGAIVLQRALRGRVDVSDKTIVVLDGTGELYDDLAAETLKANERTIYDKTGGRQVLPRLRLERGPSSPDPTRRLALSERVRKGEILAFLEIDPRALEPVSLTGLLQDPKALQRVAFCSDSLGAIEAQRRLQVVLQQVVTLHRLRRAGLDPAIAVPATLPVAVKSLGLYLKTEGGAIKNADETGGELTRLIPLGLMMLMLMSVMISAQPMLQSVLEEKQLRIAELLLGSARPFELMLGKLLGNVGMSLTILGIYFVGIYVTARSYGFLEVLPTQLLGWFLAYDVLAVLMFGSIFVAVGAACSDLKEAQNFLVPVTVLMVLPLMVWFEVVRAPMSAFATGISFFPLATPMLMLLRLGATSGVPTWQPALGILVVLATTLVCVAAAGRIFRIGILAQGKAPRLGELLRWVLRG